MTSPSIRSRKRRAGIAYIEALAVASLMALLLACAMRFERASRARLGAERGLRSDAWARALRGCARTERELLETARALAGATPSAAEERLLRAATGDPAAAAPYAGSPQPVCNEPRPAARWASPGHIDHFISSVLAGGEAP